jgi:hypothetical protein
VLDTSSPFTDVIITWTPPAIHSSPITSYNILFLKSDGTYAASGSCDGSLVGIYGSATPTCTVSMASLVTLTSLGVDQLIRVKVRASNFIGIGDYSEINFVGATVETTPSQMIAPTFDIVTSTNTQVVFNWGSLNQGAQTGGTAVSISNFRIQYYDGASWTTVSTVSGVTFTTTSSGTTLTAGQTYQFII